MGVEHGISIVDVTDPDNPSEKFFVPNDISIWQEPKTWSHYMYNTNEHDHGLLIIDLGFLPDSIHYLHWSNIPGENFFKAHTCFVDDSGFIYINGSNLFKRGCLIADLKQDPMNPVYVGKYDSVYVHDCFGQRDTLYTSEIQNGQFSVLDVHDKTNPVILATQTTPFFFSHNVWVNPEGNYLFNTDEKKFAPVTSYDISDLGNIRELDQYRHSDYDSSVVHNVYYKDGFLYVSYYRDGVVIVDAHKPDNLIEVGWYDTSPYPPQDGFEGCWGVFCFFPSGNIVCSDRQEGLFVLTPTLQRACYLEGTVTDATSSIPVSHITVEIIGNDRLKYTDITGSYKTGMADSGFYDVRFSDMYHRCVTKIVSGVELHTAQVTTLNVQLNCVFNEIEELQNDFSFYALPNVFNEHTSVFYRGRNTHAEISIHNYSGQLIGKYQIETPNAEIEFGSNLPSGVYFVTAVSGGSSKSLKVVKE